MSVGAGCVSLTQFLQDSETGSQFLVSVGDGVITQPGAWQWRHLLSSTETKTFLRINASTSWECQYDSFKLGGRLVHNGSLV